jgi:antitoxin (DNA-binding transcriptional repressor) of toxin-antitoxin stability system
MSTKVGIAEFLANADAYVARATSGERIVLCDGNTPVVELKQLRDEPLPIKWATRPWAEVAATITPVTPRVPIDVVALLREDRDQR